MAIDGVVIQPQFNGEGTNLVQGEIVRASAVAKNTSLRAQADSSAHVQGVLGVVVSGVVAPTGPVVVETVGRQRVLLVAGLTPTTGDSVYVSAATAGRGTNLAPAIAVPIGTIVDTTSYATDQSVVVIVSVGSSANTGVVFGGAPPPIAMGNTASGGAAGTAARSDQVNAQFLVADWPIATVRTFLLDPVNGNNANAGFSDVAGPYNPATQAKRDVSGVNGLQTIVPRNFAGRSFRLIVAAGAYANPEIDRLFAGTTGIGSGSVVRPTATNATAGCVAFDDSAADRVFVGATTGAGLFAAGYNPIAAFSATVLKCLQTGGGAPAFAAEPAKPLMLRVRFDAATTTAALRNVCRTIVATPANDTVTIDLALPAVPVGTDVFYIEEPGASFPTLRLQAIATPTALSPTASLQLVGISVTGAVNLGAGNLNIAFATVGSISTLSMAGFIAGQSYAEPVAGTALVVGGGLRSEGATTLQGGLTNQAYTYLLAVGLLQVLNTVQYTLANFIAAAGVNLQLYLNNNIAGAGSTSGRILAPGVVSGLDLVGFNGRIGTVGITGSGAKPACTIRATCVVVVSNGLTGATGNNDVGLDLANGAIPSRNSTIVMLSQPTVTGALGDVRLAGGQIVTWAQLFATGLIDSNGNRFVSVSQAPQTIIGKFSGACGLAGAPVTVPLDDDSQNLNNANFNRYPTSLRLFTRLRGCAPAGTGTSPITFTLYKNGVATAMTCTIVAGAAAGASAVDTAHPILFADGDQFDVVVTMIANPEGAEPVSATVEGPC